MKGLWSSGTGQEKERGLLAMYILHSLDREPKSGYALLKEIAEKTDGVWVPSKGTLYPLLKALEEEELIEVCRIGKRAKQVFEVTPRGKATLKLHRADAQESHQRIMLLRNLVREVFGEEGTRADEIVYAIHRAVRQLPPEKTEAASSILARCQDELERIA
ncbi:MAG: PadR family transcriptional regulator [Methanomicrobiaceae archaeon]|nr:PadR family transcriptional regulator [Methanomicrobiaceae archaeon]